jgi:hypothetical protein
MQILSENKLPKSPKDPFILLDLFNKVYESRNDFQQLNLNSENFFKTLKKFYPRFQNQNTGKDPKQFYLDFANLLIEYLEVNLNLINRFIFKYFLLFLKILIFLNLNK